MKKTTRNVLLAIASFALLTQAGRAQTITPSFDELILGFYATGAPGQTLNLEVDLGNMSNFYNATGPVPLPTLAVQDLVNTYGASWASRTDLFWGAVSTTGRSTGTADAHAPVGTLWATAPVGAAAFKRASKFSQENTSPSLEALVVSSAFGGALYGATPTANSSEAAVINSTLQDSWSYEDLKVAGTSFSYFNPTVDNVVSNIVGVGQAVSDLYELQPSSTPGIAGTILGQLVLTQSGLTFQPGGGVAPPVAGFTASPTNGAAPLLVNFTDASTGTITNRSWTFGDGSTSSTTSPSYSYTNAGVYSVSLQVTGPGGSSTSNFVNLITVTNTNVPPAPPVLTIVSPTNFQTFTTAGIVVTGTVSDVGTILSVTVNGTGATVIGINWTKPVTLSLGTNVLTVIATDSNANTATQSVSAVFAPIPAPVAGFTASPTNGAAPLLVNFTDASTGSITSRSWTFGDGGISSATSPTHSYITSGVFSVSLQVIGPGGTNTFSRNSMITVTNTNVPPAPPTLVLLSPTNYQIFTNASLLITGTTSDASGIQSVKVNGTAATLTGTNWSELVTLSLGTNVFTIIATDNIANTTTQGVSAVLVPVPAPLAGFTASPTNGTAPLLVTFTDASTGSITNLSWTFGDGGTSSATSPSHTYTNAGVFSVSLQVIGPGGTSTTNRINLITVTSTNAPVLAIVSPTDYQSFTNSSLVVTGTVVDVTGILSVKVNGTTATLSGTNWTELVTLTQGTNVLTVIATDNSANTATQVVHAVLAPVPAPVAGFTASPTNGVGPLLVTFTDASTGTITNRSWIFGDGATSSVTSPTHTYTNAGVFSVSLQVSGPGGSNTLTRSSLVTVTSTNAPVLAIVSPANYQTFTNSSLVVTGTVSDVTGILSVTVNGTAATLAGTNWTEQVTLAQGTNVLTVIATDNSANTATQVVHAVLAPVLPPVAGFTASPTNGVGPLLVTFTDASTGTITNRSWTFGDGGTSSATNPTHTYTNAGIFSVSLQVNGPGGSSTTNRVNLITVTNSNVPPVLVIVSPTNYQTFTNSSLVVTGTVSDASGILNVKVNGTLATLAGSNWTEQIALTQGTNVLTVIATDNNANMATQVVNAVLAPVPAPVAGFTASPTNGVGPLLVTFTDASTGSITNHSWTFGDGGTSSATSPNHTYTNAGVFSVSLQISGPGGSSTTNRISLITVTSSNVPPVLVIVSPTNYQAFTNSSLVVTGTASDPSGILSVKVNGTAATLSGTNWSESVTLAQGTNTLTVIATDNNANTATQIVHAVFAPGLPAAPVAGFTASPTNGAAPLVVTFTDASTGTVTSRSWTFGDGVTSSAISPSHSYTNAGVFSVSLQVIGPGGSNTLNRAGLITVTSTNAPPAPPVLTIVSPTNNQSFTNASLLVTGTASDASGILGVKVNGITATLVGTNWSELVTLTLGTNVLTVIATDNSANTATQVVNAVLAPASTNQTPVIVSAPTITNALLSIQNVYVVVPGETNVFNVGATSPAGLPLTYQWQFGDGVTNDESSSSIAQYAYNTNNCGPATASVTVSAGGTSITTNLTVAVACQLTVTKEQATLNFAKPDSDGYSLTATSDLSPDFLPVGQTLVLDVGGAQETFTLDSKGRGANEQGTCRLTFSKATKKNAAFWTVTIKLSHGSFADAWAAYGLTDTTVKDASVELPVIVLVGDDAFAADTSLLYTAKAGKSGSAK